MGGGRPLPRVGLTPRALFGRSVADTPAQGARGRRASDSSGGRCWAKPCTRRSSCTAAGRGAPCRQPPDPIPRPPAGGRGQPRSPQLLTPTAHWTSTGRCAESWPTSACRPTWPTARGWDTVRSDRLGHHPTRRRPHPDSAGDWSPQVASSGPRGGRPLSMTWDYVGRLGSPIWTLRLGRRKVGVVGFRGKGSQGLTVAGRVPQPCPGQPRAVSPVL